MDCHTPFGVVCILESEERWVTHGGLLLHNTYLTIEFCHLNTQHHVSLRDCRRFGAGVHFYTP